MHQNSTVSKMEIYLHSQRYYWENFKISDHKFLILKIIVLLADVGYLVKLL